MGALARRSPRGRKGAPAPAGATPLPFAAPTALLRPPPGVAAEGRRLKRGVPWPAIIVIAVFVGMWLLMQTGVFGAILSGLLGR